MTHKEIAERFDITSIAAGFAHQHIKNLKRGFIGRLNFVLYKRTDTQLINTYFSKMRVFGLDGMMPDNEGNVTEYDFWLSPLSGVQLLEAVFAPIEEQVIIFEIILTTQNKTGLIQVELVL